MSDWGCSYLWAHAEAGTRSQPTRQAAGLLLLTSDLQDVRAADQPPIVHVAEPYMQATRLRRGRTRAGRDVLLSVPAI